ncbi:MAG: hypothetical protein G01um101433_764 [Parcubacteria group bacterium Gr01-1014_33]|nr:MAG: hypothetical protein G01um101433_764 [Parcubacteria group bacterium Gr01-1014_33]
MRVTYDKQADAMYLYIGRGKIKKTIPVNQRVLIDVDKSGKLIGIELLFISQAMPKSKLRIGKMRIPVA